MYSSLLEPQSRRAQQVFGLLALAAGIFGLAVAAWLRLANLEKGWAIPIAAAVTGVYSLILARRLLGSSSRSHLISPVALVVMGAFLLFGAAAPIRYGLDVTYRYLFDAVVFFIAALTLAWRRIRTSRGSAPSTNAAARQPARAQ